ncbi:MAG: maleylpyruvate isomerase N-terminal domain-containing protein [Nocardioidaceae bacterium]
MSGAVRRVYLEAAETAVKMLSTDEVVRSWESESVLAGMTVGGLAGHLARSVLQVEWFMDSPTSGAETVSPVHYYARLKGTALTGSALNVGVRARSEETSAAGPVAVAEQTRAAWERLTRRLSEEPEDRLVAVVHRPGEAMSLDGYLQTRCVELAVHLEDLALSVNSPVRAPEGAVALAVDVLVAAARARHGDQAVLNALTRRERDAEEALRVL